MSTMTAQLDFGAGGANTIPVAAKSATEVGPSCMSAKALSVSSAFFVPAVYGGLDRGSSERRSRAGRTNSVQSATQLVGPNGGSSLAKHEGTAMNELTVLTSKIRQHDGLFSLNDLHKVSGQAAKHKPVYFLRNDQTKELIEEIQKGADSYLLPFRTEPGRNGGTYACKELVYAYAMWISPKFHLAVIRAFDAISNQTPTPTAPPAIQRTLVVTTNGLVTDTKDLTNHSIVRTDGLMKLRRNIKLVTQQLRWLQGEETPAILDKQLEEID